MKKKRSSSVSAANYLTIRRRENAIHSIPRRLFEIIHFEAGEKRIIAARINKHVCISTTIAAGHKLSSNCPLPASRCNYARIRTNLGERLHLVRFARDKIIWPRRIFDITDRGPGRNQTRKRVATAPYELKDGEMEKGGRREKRGRR